MRILPIGLYFMCGCLPQDFPGGGYSTTDTTIWLSEGSSTSSSEGSSSSTSSSTSLDYTFPEIFCGDGIVDGDEECDDGNKISDDGCNNICGRDRIVFVSSKPSTPEHMGSAKLAGDFCKQLAGAAGLPNSKSYNVWLSDSKINARDRVYNGKGRYILVDGTVIANTFDDFLLTDVIDLQHPINLDQHGEFTVDGVWTGTKSDGTLAEDANQCWDWSSGDINGRAHFGVSVNVNAKWTLHPDPEVNPTSCAFGYRTYSFEGK